MITYYSDNDAMRLYSMSSGEVVIFKSKDLHCTYN